ERPRSRAPAPPGGWGSLAGLRALCFPSVRSVLCLMALAVALAAPPPGAAPLARAQDWDVKRDPFDRKVVARYKRLLAKNPGDRGALNKLRSLYRRHRSVGLLIQEYEKELAKRPRDFSVLVVLGHLQLAEGKQAEALAFYEKAAAIRPDDPRLATAMGDLYRQGGELDKA